MRIPPNQVLFLGQHQWAEFDRPQEPLTDEIRLLLWLMDGAERRHRLAFRWSGKDRHSKQKFRRAREGLPL
jgi:hypothetical protein